MDVKITTTEMHTSGEPVRIVESGFPELKETTLLGMRREVLKKHGNVWRMVMQEPRGHFDMYGVIKCNTTDEYPDADLTVLFTHAAGLSTMCGHASIALARYAADRGLGTKDESGNTKVNIHAPCGLVKCVADPQGYGTFTSVLSWCVASEITVNVWGRDVKIDVGFGGAFYVICDVRQLDIDINDKSNVGYLRQLGMDLKEAAQSVVKLSHPDGDDMCFYYSAMLTCGDDQLNGVFPHITIFADKLLDRSPCGSGSTARMAVFHHKKQVGLNEDRKFVFSKIPQSAFKCSVVEENSIKLPGDTTPTSAVRVKITGKGYYSGQCTFTVEQDDPLAYGFLV